MKLLMAGALVAATNAPCWSQSVADPVKQYSKESMQQALQTREQYDVHGLSFDAEQSTLQPGAEPLLDDIANALKNFPDWSLRIVGHTDANGSAESNCRTRCTRHVPAALSMSSPFSMVRHSLFSERTSISTHKSKSPARSIIL